jgi:hypothetical protein
VYVNIVIPNGNFENDPNLPMVMRLHTADVEVAPVVGIVCENAVSPTKKVIKHAKSNPIK